MPETTFYTTFPTSQFLLSRAKNGSESGLRSAVSYRFGFNGQEMDNEVSGTGNTNTATFWEYDTRLGRRWNVDPKWNLRIGESPYMCFGNNPILFTDPFGDTEPERMAAVAKAREYVAKNPGNSYKLGGTDQPGGLVDCYWMVGNCITASGLPNPAFNSTVPKEFEGRGVAYLAYSKDVRKSNVQNIRAGDFVTINSGRGLTDENGTYDHVAIVTDVKIDPNTGAVVGYTIAHSFGDPSKGKSGPNYSNITVGGDGYWDKRIVDVYQWDTPEESDGYWLNTFEVIDDMNCDMPIPLPMIEPDFQNSENQTDPSGPMPMEYYENYDCENN